LGYTIINWDSTVPPTVAQRPGVAQQRRRVQRCLRIHGHIQGHGLASAAGWRQQRQLGLLTWEKWRIFNGKIMGKSWENHGKIMGKSWENHGKIMGKSTINRCVQGKIIDKVEDL